MGVLKTAAGIFAGRIAVDAFRAGNGSDSIKDKLLFDAAGSLAASASFHILKDDAVSLVQEMKTGIRSETRKQIENKKLIS